MPGNVILESQTFTLINWSKEAPFTHPSFCRPLRLQKGNRQCYIQFYCWNKTELTSYNGICNIFNGYSHIEVIFEIKSKDNRIKELKRKTRTIPWKSTGWYKQRNISLLKYNQPNAAFEGIFYAKCQKCHQFIILLAFCQNLFQFNIVLNKCCRTAKSPDVDNYRASIKK